jgi:hypothetical protein
MIQSINQSRVTTPRRAEELVLLIQEQGWHLLNVPDTPTYRYKNGQGTSVLDPTLASPTMVWEATNWVIDDAQATGSDHEVIRFEVTTTIPNPTIAIPQPHLNWSRTDWDSFSDTLRSLSTSTQPQWERMRLDPTPPHLDKWVQTLRDIIMTVAENATPPLDPSPARNDGGPPKSQPPDTTCNRLAGTGNRHLAQPSTRTTANSATNTSTPSATPKLRNGRSTSLRQKAWTCGRPSDTQTPGRPSSPPNCRLR